MKSLGILTITLLIVFACLQSNNKSGKQHAELADTLKFKTIVLQVEGMTCEGCETTISKTVRKLSGVSDVKASYLDSLAIIVFDTALANVVVISESINELGYKVVGEITQ